MDCFVNKAAFMKVLKAWGEVWQGYFTETASTQTERSCFSASEKKREREGKGEGGRGRGRGRMTGMLHLDDSQARPC